METQVKLIYTRGGMCINDMKHGTKFYEISKPFYMEMVVVGNPHFTEEHGKNVAYWCAKNINSGELVDYKVTDGYQHYGPEIYSYLSYIGLTKK